MGQVDVPLTQYGAVVRCVAQRKVATSPKASQPGAPPHSRRGLLKWAILFGSDISPERVARAAKRALAWCGGNGLDADFVVTSFSRSEPLEEALTVSVTCKPTLVTRAPTWKDGGGNGS